MLRHFVAWNLWLAGAMAMLIGRGYARRSPDYYTVFGGGFIEPVTYWFVFGVAMIVTIGCFVMWIRSIPPRGKYTEAERAPQGFEVVPAAPPERSTPSSSAGA